uniref:uncharacterized protein K02A2.6-like n=1 Tax=Styela clava TaxID=7725 RepID=UPI00193ADF91|nr:uncharacterized protein K02A2.6-like [Styela clava]
MGVLKKVESSDWASPIVPVLKADGSVRICGDFKVTINPELDVPEYPLPRPEDLFSKLNGGQKFSKLDLSEAYQQVLLDDESQKYVTINTHMGLFRYLRLPYGAASSPSIFQETMEKILQGLPNVGCILDDLIVTEKDDDSHLQFLDKLLYRLNSFGVKLKRSKCCFLQPSVEYFAFIVNAEGIHPSPKKIEAIMEIPSPENVKELQSFLGIVNYYRKFIPAMSTIVDPFNKLLKKGMKWNWNNDCKKAFVKLKDILVSSEVLVHYDPEKPLVLATDASSVGIGAVISHILPNGAEKPIAYASRTLTSAEKNYSQIEKEALAIVYGVRKFHVYLYGRNFKLLTDHQPLTMLLSPKRGIPVLTATRLQRWAIKLSAYKYEICYRNTKNNGNADALSRLPMKTDQSEIRDCWEEEATIMNINQVHTLPITPAKLRHATENDPKLSRVLLYTINGWPAKEEITNELLPFHRRKDEITVEERILLWGIRVIIPEKYIAEVLDELHENHPGMVRMKSLARLHVWFPNIDERIEQKVRDCSNCQEVRSPANKTPGNPWIWPTKPWQRIHIDYAGPIMNENFLVVVDAHSKWPEVLRMPSTTSEKTVDALRSLFSKYGLPEILVSDNAPNLSSKEFRDFMIRNGIKQIFSSPYHPSSNGEAERNVRTFKTALKTLKRLPGTLNQKLASFLLTYRTTPHSTTKCTPAELFMKRRLRTRLDLMKPNLSNSMQKRTTPVQKPIRNLEVGNRVQVRDYRDPNRKWIHGVILKKLSPVTYRVKVGSMIWKRHIDQILDMSKVKLEKSYDSSLDDDVSLPSVFPNTDVIDPNVDIPSTNENLPVNPNVSTESETQCPDETSVEISRYPKRLRVKPERLIETM